MTTEKNFLKQDFIQAFGVEPVAYREYDNLVHMTYNFKDILKDNLVFYRGLKHLKTLKNQTVFSKVIFDSCGGFHIFVGEPEAIKKLDYIEQGDDIVLELN